MKSRKWLLAAVLLAAVVVVWMSVASAVVRDGSGSDPNVGGTGGGPQTSMPAANFDSSAAQSSAAATYCIGARAIVFQFAAADTNPATAVMDTAVAEVSSDGLSWVVTPDNVKVLGTVGRQMKSQPATLMVVFREPDGNNIVPCAWAQVRLHCHTAHWIAEWRSLAIPLY